MFCTYCGLPAGGVDHYLAPRCTMRTWNIRYGHTGKEAGPTVPCCGDCNSILCTIAMPSIQKRAAYVAEKLTRKHRKLLSIEAWEDEDLTETGPRLTSFIRAASAKKRIIEGRINYSRTVALGE